MERGSRRAAPFGLLAAALAGLTDIVYLFLIHRQGPPGVDARVAFVASFIAVTVGLSIFAVVVDAPDARTASWGAATSGLLALGIVGAFSIGLPLLAAGAFAAIGWSRAVQAMRPLPSSAMWLSAVAAVVAPVILVLGIALT